MWRGLIFLTLILGLVGPGVSAQQVAPPHDRKTGAPYTKSEFVQSIRTRLAAIQKLHSKGKTESAYKILTVLQDEVADQRAFLGDHSAYWWPGLVLARLKRKDRDNAAAEQAALPIVQGLDTDKHRQSKTRLEAMLILTKALYSQKKYGESHLIAQGLLRDAPEGFPPKWQLEAESYHALAASRANSPDGEALRAALLSTYLEREHATVKSYLILWRYDLRQRRKDKSDPAKLLTDARAVYDFIRTDETAMALDTTLIEGDLARIFADNDDLKRAEPLMRQQLEAMEPGSVKYFWARQNIMAINYRQKKYTQVMRDAGLILAQLDGTGDEYANVTATIERYLGLAARKLGETAIFHDAMQRSYVSIRRVRSANNADVTKVRRYLSLSQIDPDSFPYAEELGVTAGTRAKLTLTADGSAVLRAFFDGRAITLARNLKTYADKNETSALGQLNLGLYYALAGEIGPAEEALARARTLAATHPVKSLPPESPWFDLYLIVTHTWARDWEPERARPPIARLLARTDLTKDQALTLHVMRLLLERFVDNVAAARTIYDTHLSGFDPRKDSSPWGVFRALSIMYPMFEIAPEDVDEMAAKIQETLDMAGSPKLAMSLMPVYRANTDAEFTLSNSNFQAMAFHIKALSRMLPPGHQTLVIARLAFMNGLWSRGSYSEALELLTETIDIYRSSPWHREDAVGLMDIWRADLHFALGNSDLAFALLEQAYQAMDPETYRPTAWVNILTFYAYALFGSDQPDDALAVTKAALANHAMQARLIPLDRSNLLRAHATMLEAIKRYDEALAVLNEADEVLPSASYRNGVPRMYVMEQAAYLHYVLEDYQAAYRAMSKANDIYFRSMADAAATSGSDIQRDRTREKYIVQSQATYAWLLAQQLKEAQ